MKYIKKFSQESEYQEFINSMGGVHPNISSVGTHGKLFFKEIKGQYAGDVAYWDGQEVKTISSKLWHSRLGTPIGVVVVPAGFAPDGKARIVSLYGVDENGSQAKSNINMTWGPIGVDTDLIDYNFVPTIDNVGSTSIGLSRYGFLPSVNFDGPQSLIDPKAFYKGNTPMIPSPYLGDEPNSEYYKNVDGGNVLSDFNGLNNTRTLVGLGADYVAANACWNYSDGSSNLQWYLPATGELGYLIVRLSDINDVLTSIGGVSINQVYFWSNSEYYSDYAYHLTLDYGFVGLDYKYSSYYVRPFAII